MATGPSPDQAEGRPVQLGEAWLPGTGHGGVIREGQAPSPQGCSPTSSFPFLINSGMGVGRGVTRLPLEFSYLRVFQLSFSMWFSGPSLSKEAMKRAERREDPQKPCPHTVSLPPTHTPFSNPPFQGGARPRKELPDQAGSDVWPGMVPRGLLCGAPGCLGTLRLLWLHSTGPAPSWLSGAQSLLVLHLPSARSPPSCTVP